MERYRCLFKGFAWILIMCLLVVSCRKTIIHNYEVDDAFMQKIEFKDSLFSKCPSGDYYLLVVKLKDANVQTHYFSVVCKNYLDGISNQKEILKVDLYNAKDSVIPDSLIGARGKYPFGLIKFDLRNSIPAQLYCKKIEKLSSVPEIINDLSICYFVYDKSTGIHYFSTIVFVKRGIKPKTISLETADGAFHSEIKANPVHAEVIDTITNYDYLH